MDNVERERERLVCDRDCVAFDSPQTRSGTAFQTRATISPRAKYRIEFLGNMMTTQLSRAGIHLVASAHLLELFEGLDSGLNTEKAWRRKQTEIMSTRNPTHAHGRALVLLCTCTIDTNTRKEIPRRILKKKLRDRHTWSSTQCR